MNHKKTTTCLFFLLLTWFSAAAFGNERPKRQIDNFLERLPNATRLAVNQLFLTNLTFSTQDREAFRQELDRTLADAGPLRDTALVAALTYAEGVEAYTMIAIFERFPVQFEFVFFEVNRNWRLLTVTIAKDVRGLVLETMRTGIRQQTIDTAD